MTRSPRTPDRGAASRRHRARVVVERSDPHCGDDLLYTVTEGKVVDVERSLATHTACRLKLNFHGTGSSW